ncbi:MULTISPECIES: Lrp/AsnC family transcriptional regulator [Pseudovibrio]|uniref:Lrp/AsnC family transcriptional regulator n=1 Tax=Stappiaceae TaxID=2821832 RepID=UPI00236603E6|nr:MULTISPECIES: Lrp/AsnC family transcriptional regulator [Pseudovibrio]MDD7909077.1 Lrp/AsnC family transcriptional regulator [Pseudovibrio exalbescens]MDX5593602.1 Lrp/AsnC family transcriptional regulator [Pseudovibrio sp. SPO723]
MPDIKDDLDRKLISILQANAREPVSSISRRLNVARSTVQERITRLERNGVIAGYTALLGDVHAGQQVQAVVMLSVAQQQSKTLVKQLESYPEIRVCYTISGEFDLFLIVEPSRLEELDDILDEIAAIPGVVRSRSSIVLSKKFERQKPIAPSNPLSSAL